MAYFFTTAIDNLRRDAHHGSAIGYNVCLYGGYEADSNMDMDISTPTII